MKNKRLLESIGYIDTKYIEEAEPKMKNSQGTKRILKAVACFAIVICLGLYLFLPYRSTMTDLTAYNGSEYFPLIEAIEDYRYVPPKYNNNFESLVAFIGALGSLGKFGAGMDSDNMSGAPGDAGNSMEGSVGKYEEVTDNQVAGVIEADIFKRTDKYIFRITNEYLTVYSIDGENSKEISKTHIPILDNEYAYTVTNLEMYLSEDGQTVTLIKEYSNKSKDGEVGIISLDVSDVTNVKLKGTVSIEGSYNTSRMVDGRLLLITEFYFNAKKADYSKPETYVPSITRGETKECMRFEDIIFPEDIGHTRYSVVALVDEESLDVLGASALLNYTDTVYVSKENVYLARSYNKDIPITIGERHFVNKNMTDVAVLSYGEETLEKKGIITFEGTLKDQYSLDEMDGYLRVVASTRRTYKLDYRADNYSEVWDAVSYSSVATRSASLYVFKLEDNSLVAEVKDFAPDGEQAESVRFNGDTAYVCTAVVVTFTDPVFFFNLSDYSNITYTDTGVIEGYSTSLINLRDGFLLGIGRENWSYNKVEVYEEIGNSVESVDVFKFMGSYSLEYKAYLVNREENLFGFAVKGYTTDYYKTSGDTYILLIFDGYKLIAREITEFEFTNPDRVRAAYIDGYLYLTSDNDFKVVSTEVE